MLNHLFRVFFLGGKPSLQLQKSLHRITTLLESLVDGCDLRVMFYQLGISCIHNLLLFFPRGRCLARLCLLGCLVLGKRIQLCRELVMSVLVNGHQ